MMRRFISFLAAGTVLVILGLAGRAEPAGGQTITQCAHVQGHKFEICFAYLVNCVDGALGPYYAFGRSSNPARARAARFRFESRYVGQARRLVEQRVQEWPIGRHKAGARIKILSISSNLGTNTAMLVTRESWVVLLTDNRPLLHEYQVKHRITMRRVPGLLVHKWVVSNIS